MSQDPYDTTGTSPPNPMPALAPDEYEALKASIYRHGVLQPIIVSIDGDIIDGHHRLKIYRESFHTADYLSDPEAGYECDIAGDMPRLPVVIVTDKPQPLMEESLKGGAAAKWHRENEIQSDPCAQDAR